MCRGVVKISWFEPVSTIFPLRHHAHPLGHVAHDAEVVGNQQHRHVQLALKILEELQDLGLDGYVEGGGGLVRNQQLRLVGQRHRDHHPLALPAGKLVGIGVETMRGVLQTNQFEQFEGALVGHLRRQPLVHHQCFAHLLGDRM